MRVIRDGKCVKIIPKKYEDVVGDYKFLTERMRLAKKERFELIQRLIPVYLNELGKSSVLQEVHAAEQMLQLPFEYDIIKVDRRDHIQWRIGIKGYHINVYADLVSDCPDQFLIHKNEF
jgi:hypothetical protein